jgi:hypothetical protein
MAQGLRAIYNLTTENDSNQAKLGEHGACAGIWLFIHFPFTLPKQFFRTCFRFKSIGFSCS